MNILLFLFIGIVSGWIAGELYRGSGFGIGGDLVVGIVGSLIGGYLLGGVFGVSAYGIVGSILTSVVGALVLLFFLHLLRRA